MDVNNITRMLVGTAAALLVMPFAAAVPIDIGTYRVLDHPDGGLAPPEYCLRLDGLLGAGRYTFSCDDGSADVTLSYDGSDIAIAGTVFGGRDIGGSWDSATYWNLEFLYQDLTTWADGGYHDLRATTGNYTNFGRIWNDSYSFNLTDFGMGHYGYTFRLGDRSGGGHRGYPGISGWGWVNHYTDVEPYESRHVYASDFLFTVTKVPEPGTLALLGTGLLVLGFSRRRRP